MRYKKFDCECNIDLDDVLNLKKINFDCKSTWDLIGTGRTGGLFQLDGYLGKKWSKILKPENLQQLAALTSLLRPGALNVLDNKNISATEHYCRRKNNEEEITYYDQVLEPVLQETFGMIVFQEQCTKISEVIAGFNPQDADLLRKSIGKKDVETMSKVEKQFINGVIKTKIVSEENGRYIFSCIKESQKYLFNKSHAYSYGIISYQCAYLKCHFPLYFYTSWLYYAKDKQDPQDEIKSLVNEAKLFNIDVLPPDIMRPRKNFSTDGAVINFGFIDIKGIGESHVDNLRLISSEIKTTDWFRFLVYHSDRINSKVLETLIKCGALQKFSYNRRRMLFEKNIYDELTDKEKEWIRTRLPDMFESKNDSLLTVLRSGAMIKRNGGMAHNKNRLAIIESLIKLLENPPNSLNDDAAWIISQEKELLGVALSQNNVDNNNCFSYNSCKDFISGNVNDCRLLVTIERVTEKTIKKGDNIGRKMVTMLLSDGTGLLDNAVAFSDVYEPKKELFYEGNTIIIKGKRSYKDKDSLFISEVSQGVL